MSIDALAQDPQFGRVRLSPDGQQLLALVRRGSQILLIARAVKGGESPRPLMVFSADDPWLGLSRLRWVRNDRLLVVAMNHERRALGRTLFLVPSDGSAVKALLRLPSTLPGPWEVDGPLLDLPLRDGRFVWVQVADGDHDGHPQLVEIDIESGDRRVVQAAESGVVGWMVDAARQVRGRVQREGSITQIQLRATTAAEWRTAWRSELPPGAEVRLLGFEPDGGELVAAVDEPGKTFVMTLDSRGADRPLRTVAAVPRQFGPRVLARDPDSKRSIGLIWDLQDDAVQWDDGAATLQSAIDRALPGRTNRIVHRSDDGRRYVVRSEAGHQPAQYFIGHRPSGELAFLADSRPSLRQQRFAAQSSVVLRARDGTLIDAAWTLPVRGTTGGLPAAIVLRGPGFVPQRFDPLVQLLADRGIAVLELGSRQLTARDLAAAQAIFRSRVAHGFEDVIEAARWLARDGGADPSRICVVAHGLLAQAALMAAVQAPDRLRCVALHDGVTDLLDLAERASRGRLESWLGDWLWSVRWEVDRLKELSPVEEAARVRAAVQLAVTGGPGDMAYEQAYRVASKMRGAGRSVEVVEHAASAGDSAASGPTRGQQLRAHYLRDLERFVVAQQRGASSQPAAASAASTSSR